MSFGKGPDAESVLVALTALPCAVRLFIIKLHAEAVMLIALAAFATVCSFLAEASFEELADVIAYFRVSHKPERRRWRWQEGLPLGVMALPLAFAAQCLSVDRASTILLDLRILFWMSCVCAIIALFYAVFRCWLFCPSARFPFRLPAPAFLFTFFALPIVLARVLSMAAFHEFSHTWVLLTVLAVAWCFSLVIAAVLHALRRSFSAAEAITVSMMLTLTIVNLLSTIVARLSHAFAASPIRPLFATDSRVALAAQVLIAGCILLGALWWPMLSNLIQQTRRRGVVQGSADLKGPSSSKVAAVGAAGPGVGISADVSSAAYLATRNAYVALLVILGVVLWPLIAIVLGFVEPFGWVFGYLLDAENTLLSSFAQPTPRLLICAIWVSTLAVSVLILAPVGKQDNRTHSKSGNSPSSTPAPMPEAKERSAEPEQKSQPVPSATAKVTRRQVSAVSSSADSSPSIERKPRGPALAGEAGVEAAKAVAGPRWPNILVRKYYHILAVALFTPAVAMEPFFVGLALAVALAIFVLLEYIRISRLPPFGEAIHKFMQSYLDERDSGIAILTHTYLLLGCALPLWLHSPALMEQLASASLAALNAHQLVPALCGVFILGIGDTAASYFGIRSGKRRWPGTRKTVEGTVGAIVAILVTIICLDAMLAWGRPFENVRWWGGVTVATIAACLLEAFTTQIDNLFLPLFYYAALVMMC